MKEPLISVIIPIYNCENFLERCINSVINQTYSNLEIILINDGSTDSTQKICEKYVDEDSRIKLFSFDYNRGTVSAYLYGIEHANGDLISFIDADDFVEAEMLSELYMAKQKYNAELAACSHTYYSYDDNCVIFERTMGYEDTICISNFEIKKYFSNYHKINVLNNSILLYRVNKLYTKDLVLRNIKYVDTSLTMFEDNCLVISCLLDADKIAYVDKPFYNYVMYNSEKNKSVMHTINPDVINTIPTLFTIIGNIFRHFGVADSAIYFHKRTVYTYLFTILCFENINDMDYSNLKALQGILNIDDGFAEYFKNNKVSKKKRIGKFLFCNGYFRLFKIALIINNNMNSLKNKMRNKH